MTPRKHSNSIFHSAFIVICKYVLKEQKEKYKIVQLFKGHILIALQTWLNIPRWYHKTVCFEGRKGKIQIN